MATEHPTQHVALYPGSFDPVTLGHLDVIERGRRLFDKLFVGVGNNPDKRTLFTAEERAEMIRRAIAEMPQREGLAPVEVVSYSDLTVDFAKAIGAGILLRGVRNLSDMQYEAQQAVTNRQLADIETAFVVAGSSFAYVSSSLIRQITALGHDLSPLSSMCPPSVVERLIEKKNSGNGFLSGLRG